MYLRGHQSEGGLVPAGESWLSPSREEEGGATSAGHQGAEVKEGHVPCTSVPCTVGVCGLSLELISSAVFHIGGWKKQKVPRELFFGSRIER